MSTGNLALACHCNQSPYKLSYADHMDRDQQLVHNNKIFTCQVLEHFRRKKQNVYTAHNNFLLTSHNSSIVMNE